VTAIIVIAAFYLVFAVVSARLPPLMLSVPMVFVGFGLLIGTEGVALITPTEDPELVTRVLEITLVLTLFGDAAKVSFGDLRRESTVPFRLLVLGLPLAIATGWLVGLPLLGGLGLMEIAVVATILAPTDAALGQAVVQNPRVPAVVRHGLGVESGLNDGIALPVLTLLLTGAAIAAGEERSLDILETFVRGLLLSAVVGAAAGLVGGWLLVRCDERGWVAKYWRRAVGLSVALLAWGLAVWLDGSGFIGAWVGGLAFGLVVRRRIPNACDVVEELSSILITLSFLFFGALLLGPALHHLTWQMALYGVLSLTLVRMVPVALSMLGSGFRGRSVLYMGWFGPRGLASIVFVGLVVRQALPATDVVVSTVMFAVGLSVLLHGATAYHTSQSYGAWYERAHERALETGVPLAESAEVMQVKVPRRPHLGAHR